MLCINTRLYNYDCDNNYNCNSDYSGYFYLYYSGNYDHNGYNSSEHNSYNTCRSDVAVRSENRRRQTSYNNFCSGNNCAGGYTHYFKIEEKNSVG